MTSDNNEYQLNYNNKSKGYIMQNQSAQMLEVQKTMSSVGIALSEARERVLNLELNDLGNSDLYRKNAELIETSKQQVHQIIEQYFKDLSDNYVFLQSKYPSKDVQQLIIKQIDRTFQELSEYQTKIQNNTFTMQDYQFFQQANFLQVKKEVQEETTRITNQNQENTYANHTEQNMPQVRIQNRVIEGLYLGLNQYASVQWPGETPKNIHDKLLVQQANYFQTQSCFLPLINEQKNSVSVYNLNSHQTQQIKLNTTQLQMNQQSSLVQTPNGDIWISGGVNLTGQIQNQFLLIDVDQFNFNRKADMLVKRVGHGLCYVPHINTGVKEASELGYIYAIGGRTDNNVRTKLCERYNLQTGQWEQIDKMVQARARPVVVYYQESQSIYVFFGTDSQSQNVHTCERYDILTNKWFNVLLQNYLPGFDMTYGTGLVVNQDQILIFGGLRDSMYFKDHLYFNKKLLLYNTQNDSMTVLDTYLPIDFIPVCPPVVHNNSVYALGTFMSCQAPPPNQMMWLDGAFAIEINQNGAKVADYLDSNLKQII